MFKANGKGNAVRLVLSVATVAVLAACSSPQDRKMANRGFEYEESRLEGRAFLVPAGLSTPAFNSNFDIPALPESSREGAIGAKVDVRPPAQLLTVVPGSQVVAKASEAGVPIPGFSSALSYYDLVRAKRTNAALTQGLRDFFEIDARAIAFAALKALADEGELPAGQLVVAAAQLGWNKRDATAPWLR